MRKQLVILGFIFGGVFVDASVPSKLNAFTEGDRLVYSQIVRAYKKDQRAELSQQLRLLAKNYPQSVHLDNAFYLKAMLDFQQQRWAEAIRSFATVRTKFPNGNKRPAAMLGIAMSYLNLGLKVQANRVFGELIREYPGSSEALRAKVQLKVQTGVVR